MTILSKTQLKELLWGIPTIFILALSIYFATILSNQIHLVYYTNDFGNYYFATDSNLGVVLSTSFFTVTALMYIFLIWEYSPFSLFQFIHDLFIVLAAFPIALLIWVSGLYAFSIFLLFPILSLYVDQLVPKDFEKIRFIFFIPFSFSTCLIVSIDLFYLPLLPPFSIGVIHLLACLLAFSALLFVSKQRVENFVSGRLWFSTAISWLTIFSTAFFFFSHALQKTPIPASSTHLFLSNSIILLTITCVTVLLMRIAIQFLKREYSPGDLGEKERINIEVQPNTSSQTIQFTDCDEYSLFSFCVDEIKRRISPENEVNYVWLERLRISLFLQKKAQSNKQRGNEPLSNDQIKRVLENHPLLSEIKPHDNRGFPMRKEFSLGRLLSKS